MPHLCMYVPILVWWSLCRWKARWNWYSFSFLLVILNNCSKWQLTLLTCSEIPSMHFQFWCLDHSVLLKFIISYKKVFPSWDDNNISDIHHRSCSTMTPCYGLPLIWCMLSLVSVIVMHHTFWQIGMMHIYLVLFPCCVHEKLAWIKMILP